MSLSFRLSTSFAALIALTACGGSGGDSRLETYQNRLEADIATGTALFETPGTAWNAMPTSGSANYTGGAAVFIDPDEVADADDILIVGDSHLTANFGAGTMTGRIDNMTAATNMTETDADIYNVNGQIEIGGSRSIIGDDFDDNLTNRPNDWYADYYGNVAVNGDRYEVEGTIDGQFVGTRPNPAQGQSPTRGVIGVSEDGFATINGQYEVNEAFVGLEIFGQN